MALPYTKCVYENFNDLMYTYFVLVGLMGANVIVPRTVDCECLNTKEHNHEECVDNVAHCSNSDSDKPSSCFVLWATDNVTGYNTLKNWHIFDGIRK